MTFSPGGYLACVFNCCFTTLTEGHIIGGRRMTSIYGRSDLNAYWPIALENLIAGQLAA